MGEPSMLDVQLWRTTAIMARGMKLVSFTVQDFRSITKAYKIHLGQSTVLLGPNNAGKSNVLKALVAAMEVLTLPRPALMTILRNIGGPARWLDDIYKWESDYPVAKQRTNSAGESLVDLEFELTEEEIAAFRSTVRSKLTGTLPLRICFGRKTIRVEVVKKGPGAKQMTAKSALIAEFISEHLDFQYIQAIRTAEQAEHVVARMLDRKLRVVESDAAYTAALEQIEELQRPVLEQLGQSIRDTLVTFLPAVKDVRVRIAAEARTRALRRSEVIINDGHPTPLRFKGDGVQSLAALALMRHRSDASANGKSFVVALEEPESHLHPSAIHSLKEVLDELAQSQQVVITTHCPLFVHRSRMDRNIIVNKSKARSAKNVEEIRSILGVRASDNLRHAELVLLVEGEEDRRALNTLLRSTSEALRGALTEGHLAIDTLSGGSNLAYKVTLIRDALCSCHCFLDNDKAGLDGFKKAQSQKLLTLADANFAICDGMAESEIEDMYNSAVYEAEIQNGFGVSLQSPKFKTSKKWSERMKETFRNQGKPWDDKIEINVKTAVADAVAGNPELALNAHKRSSYDALVAALESKIIRSVNPI
jgi:predicted ATP-dependent endonuclease of OLD family